MQKKFGISLLSAIAMALLFIGVVVGMSMGSVDGVWEFIEDGGNGAATCDAWATGDGSSITSWSSRYPSIQSPPTTDENQVRYGGLASLNGACPYNTTTLAQSSGFGFKGNSNIGTLTPNIPILLGKATHFNNPIYVSNTLDWVDLDMTISNIQCGGGESPAGSNSRTYIYRVYFDETPNTAPCAYGATNGPCDDKITIETISLQSQPIDCTSTSVPASERGTFTLQILGWVFDVNQDGNCSDTPYDPSTVSSSFITPESQNSYVCLYGTVTNFTPTAVDLHSFNAGWVGEHLEVTWETVTETNTLGFNIFRSTSRFGTQLKLNSDLIFSNSIPGSLLGGEYQFTDLHAVEGVEYFYWLQEVELDGTTASHGPAEFTN